MRIKNVFKYATMGIILSVFTMTTSNATTPELLVEDGYVSLSKYLFFSSATLEKRVVDLKDESLSKYKYIVVLNSSEEDKKNIIEIFENGAGAYINGQYIPFESAKVSGFSVPARISIKEKNGEVYLPTSFFVDYLDSQILEDGKLSVNKFPEIEEGIVGEFNDLSSFTTNKISDSSSEKIEDPKDKLGENTTNNNTNKNVNNKANSGNTSTSQGGNSNNSNTGSNNNSNSIGSGNSNQGSNNNSNNNSGSNNEGSTGGSNNSGNTTGNNTDNSENTNSGNSGDNSNSSGNDTNNGSNENINDSNDSNGNNTNGSDNNDNNVNEDNNTGGNQENENNGQTDDVENNQSNTQAVPQDEITKVQ